MRIILPNLYPLQHIKQALRNLNGIEIRNNIVLGVTELSKNYDTIPIVQNNVIIGFNKNSKLSKIIVNKRVKYRTFFSKKIKYWPLGYYIDTDFLPNGEINNNVQYGSLSFETRLKHKDDDLWSIRNDEIFDDQILLSEYYSVVNLFLNNLIQLGKNR